MVADSADSLSCFRFIIIFCNVCTSSEWNSVKRIFLGSARDGGQYPWLSRHNQPSTRPMTTRTTTSSSLCVCMFGGAVPPPCVPLCLGPSILSLVHSIIDCCTTPTPLSTTQVSVSLSTCLVLANCLNDLECDLHEGCRRQDPDSCTRDDKTQLFVDSSASASPSLLKKTRSDEPSGLVQSTL